MTEDQWLWAKTQLGLSDDQRTDIGQRFARLGSLRAVALDVLGERRAAMLANPGFSSVTVPGAISVSQSLRDQVAAIERWMNELRSGPDDPSAPIGPDDDVHPEDRPLGVSTMLLPASRRRSGSRRWRHPDTW